MSELDYFFILSLSAREHESPVPSGSTFNSSTFPSFITIENLFDRNPPRGGKFVPKSTALMKFPFGSANMRI